MPLDLKLTIPSHATYQMNARLFYQLAQFVVWGQAHTDLIARDADLGSLLETATLVLSKAGIPEDSVASPAKDNSTNPVLDSESVVSAFIPDREASHGN